MRLSPALYSFPIVPVYFLIAHIIFELADEDARREEEQEEIAREETSEVSSCFKSVFI